MDKKVKMVVGLGLLTAVVFVLQYFAIAIRFGVFCITLVLIPIVVGAALYGELAGAWLGLVFGATVLLSGDANAFLVINPAGTVITVLVKGLMSGLCAALMYKIVEKYNKYVACFAAAIVAPIVNTGIFVIGCRLFFFETIKAWAAGAGFTSAWKYILIGFIGLNFLVELAVNIVLSPAAFRLVNIARKEKIA